MSTSLVIITWIIPNLSISHIFFVSWVRMPARHWLRWDWNSSSSSSALVYRFYHTGDVKCTADGKLWENQGIKHVLITLSALHIKFDAFFLGFPFTCGIVVLPNKGARFSSEWPKRGSRMTPNPRAPKWINLNRLSCPIVLGEGVSFMMSKKMLFIQ